MPTVPTYQRTETLRPAYRQDVDVRATPGAAGAAIGQGMQRVAGAVGQVAEYANMLEEARAKDADNALANWAIERMHGKNGYLNTEGVNAVDTFQALTADIEAKRREIGGGLTGAAANMFERASQARLMSLTQQAMIHRGGEEKKWIIGTSKARAEVFHNTAVANWNMPTERAKNIEAGKLEIATLADKMGWGKDQRDLANLEFTTGVHTSVALEYAKTDYFAADKYLKDNAAAIDPDKMAAIRNQLEPDRINAEAESAFSELMNLTRTFDAGNDAPAAPKVARPKASGDARSFLRSRLVGGKDVATVDNLSQDFASGLAAMIQDAPAEIRNQLRIRSGARDNDEQAVLWERALKQYGSAAAARKWVAPPGKSRHNHGDAADLQYGSAAARQWVHANAGKYGLRFPLGNEPWHIERTGSGGSVTVEANGAGRSPRAALPDMESVWARVQTISDPRVRDAVWNKYRGYMAVQSAADEDRRKAAQDQYWSYILKGNSPDQIPMDLRRAVGMSTESSAWSYFRQRSEGQEVTTNEGVFNSLVQEAEIAPEVFAKRSIGELAPYLSKSDLRTINKMQGQVRAKSANGESDVSSLVKFGRTEAKSRLEALGITTTGKTGEARAKEAKRVIDFENTLYRQILLAAGSKDKPLTKDDVLSMVDSLTAERVFTKERDWWFDSEVSKPIFEVDYADIPATDRKMIEDRFARQFGGKKPSATQVEDLYQQYLMSRN